MMICIARTIAACIAPSASVDDLPITFSVLPQCYARLHRIRWREYAFSDKLFNMVKGSVASASAANKLRRWRKRERLSQSACADRSDTTQATWSRVESGLTAPTLDMARAIQALTDGLIRVSDW